MRKQVSYPVWKIIEIGAPLAEIYSANKYNVNRKKFCFFSVNWWIKDIPVPSLYERGIWLLRYRNFDPTLMTSYCLIPVPSGQDAHGSRVSPVLAFKVTLTTWNTIVLMQKNLSTKILLRLCRCSNSNIRSTIAATGQGCWFWILRKNYHCYVRNLGMFFLTDIDERVILTFLAPLGISVSLALPFLLTLESYCFTFSSHLEPLPPQMPHLSDFTGDPIICVKCKEEGIKVRWFIFLVNSLLVYFLK